MSHLQAIRDQVNLEWRRTNDDKWNEAIECAVAIIDQYMAAKPSPPALVSTKAEGEVAAPPQEGT